LIYSMTGFGRGETAFNDGKIIIELSTLNSRYLEVQVRGLREQGELELLVRDRISQVLKRGKVSAQVVFSGVKTTEKTLSVDSDLAKLVSDEYGRIADNLGISPIIPPDAIIRNENIFKVTEVNQVNDQLNTQLKEALDSALDRLLAMRGEEGKRLIADIRTRFAELGNLVNGIGEESTDQVSDYRDRLRKTAEELLQKEVDPGRLEQELVFYADRADITEEIIRLRSHLTQVEETLESGGRIGRRLDFVIQEINRELNTIGSKSCKAGISSAVVQGKDLLEQIREQVQNIE